MSSSPLLPWIANPGQTPLTETLTDPVSEASITLPRLNGLTVNEVMFLGHAATQYLNLNKGLSSDPKVVAELTQFCHNFLCLRLELADWGGDGLVFEGAPLKPSQTLQMTGGDGQTKAAPLYMLYLIYGFAVDEESRWLGKRDPDMLGKILKIIAQSIGETSGEASTGDSSESTPDTPDSPAKHSEGAQPTSLQQRSKTSKKAA